MTEKRLGAEGLISFEPSAPTEDPIATEGRGFMLATDREMIVIRIALHVLANCLSGHEPSVGVIVDKLGISPEQWGLSGGAYRWLGALQRRLACVVLLGTAEQVFEGLEDVEEEDLDK